MLFKETIWMWKAMKCSRLQNCNYDADSDNGVGVGGDDGDDGESDVDLQQLLVQCSLCNKNCKSQQAANPISPTPNI